MTQFRCIEHLLTSSSGSLGRKPGIMKTLNTNNLQRVSISSNVLRARKRSSAMRPGVDRTKAIAAPERMQEQQQDTIRLLDLDNAEQSRLEQTDAFKELVALNRQKQSVNRPQKVRSIWRSAARTARTPGYTLEPFFRQRSSTSARIPRSLTASQVARNATERLITRAPNSRQTLWDACKMSLSTHIYLNACSICLIQHEALEQLCYTSRSGVYVGRCLSGGCTCKRLMDM